MLCFILRDMQAYVLVAGFALAAGCSGHSTGSQAVPGVGPADVGGYQHQRVYSPGKEYRYRMVRSYFENGKFKREEVAESIHVVAKEPPLSERIAFDRLSRTQDGKTDDLSEAIAKFPAWDVSLSPTDGGVGLALPDILGWDMAVVGPVTDLLTFWVAISPQAGIDKVSKVGQSYVLPEAPVASWANGVDIPVGQDCIQISITLKELGESTAVFETRFMPPEEASLKMLKSWMDESVVEGTPNNFQQQMSMGEAAMVMWGREYFVVTSTVRRADGMLLSATMSNELQLKMKIGCSSELQACKHEVPLHIRRELSLELQE